MWLCAKFNSVKMKRTTAIAAKRNDINKSFQELKNVQPLLLQTDCCDPCLLISDKTIQSLSCLSTDKTGGDMIGKRSMKGHSSDCNAALFSKVFRAIELLVLLYNLYAKNTSKTKKNLKHKVQKKLIGRIFFYISLLALPSGINTTSVAISPSHDYTIFENNASNFTFNCSGKGALLLWTVDGYSTGTSYVLNKSISSTHYIVSPDEIVSSQLIVPTTKANNNITVICTVQNSSFFPQSSTPVKLFLQGILPPPQHFEINFSNSSVNLCWIAPVSLQLSTPPTISHYILSNNSTNDTKIFISNLVTCSSMLLCNYSLDLRDPFFKNTNILDYNSTVKFTLFAVNGAGIGHATTYILQRIAPTGVEYHQSPTVPFTGSIPAAGSNPTVSMLTSGYAMMNSNLFFSPIVIAVVVAVGILLCISVPVLVLFVQSVRKQKVATTNTTSAVTNEYIAQSTFVTQLDDPYFVHVTLYLHRNGTNNRKRSQQNLEEITHSDAVMTPMRTHLGDDSTY